MMSSLRTLANAVDRLCERELAAVTEAPFALTIAALNATDAVDLLPLLNATGWSFEIVDRAGECTDKDTLTEDYAPFIITVQKPGEATTLQVITAAGFETFLLQERDDAIWEVATLTIAFATAAAIFLPWGSAEIFSPAPTTKSPRQLVRDYNMPPTAPSDIRVWMPRTSVTERLWSEPVFQVFADLSAQALMRALAGEIKSDGSLVFKGPPHTQLNAPQRRAAKELKLNGYNDLRAAATWVYENGMEAEQRHGLFTAEFGRTHPSERGAAAAFSRVTSNVLEGARLAYQLSLSELTREAIKAQGDLRKAVVDDTAKLADNTRQVVMAVAAALATCVGLVAAKITTTMPHWVLQVIASIAAVYVSAIVISGWIFMSVQRDMRGKWRSRLYRFIPDTDYKAMVLDPAKRAERMFTVGAVAGGIVAALAISMVFLGP